MNIVNKASRGGLLPEVRLGTSDELPVLATDRKSADRAFTQIVVNRQTAVGRKDIQCFPVVQDISNGLARG